MNEEEINTYAARYVEEVFLSDEVDFAHIAEFLDDGATEGDWESICNRVVDIVAFLRDRVDLYFDR